MRKVQLVVLEENEFGHTMYGHTLGEGDLYFDRRSLVASSLGRTEFEREGKTIQRVILFVLTYQYSYPSNKTLFSNIIGPLKNRIVQIRNFWEKPADRFAQEF